MMGNQQSNRGSLLPSACVQAGRRTLTYQGNRYRQFSLGDSETTSICSQTGSTCNTEDDAISLSEDDQGEGVSNNNWLSDANELEAAILADDAECIKKICVEQKIDLNMQLNEKGETALILAVKLSRIEIVKILLLTPNCDKNFPNIHNFSPLDIALVTAFDNRLEPRHSICWEIIECLLQVNAEPNSKDAMMYFIRTALKCFEEKFIYRLILLAQEFSNSTSLHDLLLLKLHRHQPVYMESLDPIFISMANFTIKLLKNSNGNMLCETVNSMIYYLDSYWNSQTKKISVFKKLVVFATGAGWDWTDAQLGYINRVCPIMGVWCRNQKIYPKTLQHLARKSFRRQSRMLIPLSIEKLPDKLPTTIIYYIMLKDIDEFVSQETMNMANFQL